MKLYIIQYTEPAFKRSTLIWLSLKKHEYSQRFLEYNCFTMLESERKTFEEMENMGLSKNIEPSKTFHIVKP